MKINKNYVAHNGHNGIESYSVANICYLVYLILEDFTEGNSRKSQIKP